MINCISLVINSSHSYDYYLYSSKEEISLSQHHAQSRDSSIHSEKTHPAWNDAHHECPSPSIGTSPNIQPAQRRVEGEGKFGLFRGMAHVPRLQGRVRTDGSDETLECILYIDDSHAPS